MTEELRRPIGYEDATIQKVPAHVLSAFRSMQRGGRSGRPWPLFLTGPVGTGKTCAAAVLYGAFHTGRPLWYRADVLLAGMASAATGRPAIQSEYYDSSGIKKTRKQTLPEFLDLALNAPCVFLDDLGTREASESMYASLLNLMEIRRRRPLVITSNLSLPELAKLYDDRIADRLAAGTRIKFTGDSRREQTQLVGPE